MEKVGALQLPAAGKDLGQEPSRCPWMVPSVAEAGPGGQWSC